MSKQQQKRPLTGKVALVTGATRGIGKGIALQLGEAGATVYITGRTLQSSNGMGSLEETANEIRNRGGKCIPVQVDHEDDYQISKLFSRIDSEQAGQLDILINNAYKAVETLCQSSDLKFWELRPEIWDDINNVGLRNHYLCTVYAARLMVPRKQGLIINISSYGGTRYLFNVAYGAGKAAVDRIAIDCGIELKKHNIACLSLYPGPVKTELVQKLVLDKQTDTDSTVTRKSNQIKLTNRETFANGESIEFAGKCVVSLATNPKIMNYTSRIVVCSDYAQSYGIKDIDNRVIPSMRQINLVMQMLLPKCLLFLASFVPNCLKVPQFIVDIFNTKF